MSLEERAQQIAAAHRAKSRFLANVSHELRTPLNAIVGYNSLALDGLYGELSAHLRVAHERIRTAAEHLLNLVNDILDLSKIEVGRMEVTPERVDLAAVLDGVAAVVEPIAAAKGVRLDVVVGRDLPALETDARHLRQILLHLASNAVKFTERGSVTIAARRDGARAAVAVSDTGVGIAAGDLDRIFDEFEQVRPGGRGDSIERGTGLGLALARKLARLLGGDVTVESQVGAGSRFTLTLPVSGAAARAERDEGAAVARATEELRADAAPDATPGVTSGASASASETSGEAVAFGPRDDASGLDATSSGD
jgi:signal transduction histidine kinase